MVHDLGVVFIAVVNEHDLQAVPLGHLPRDVVAVLVVEVGVVAGVSPADGGGAPVEGGGPGAGVLGEDVQQDGEGAVRVVEGVAHAAQSGQHQPGAVDGVDADVLAVGDVQHLDGRGGGRYVLQGVAFHHAVQHAVAPAVEGEVLRRPVGAEVEGHVDAAGYGLGDIVAEASRRVVAQHGGQGAPAHGRDAPAVADGDVALPVRVLQRAGLYVERANLAAGGGDLAADVSIGGCDLAVLVHLESCVGGRRASRPDVGLAAVVARQSDGDGAAVLLDEQLVAGHELDEGVGREQKVGSHEGEVAADAPIVVVAAGIVGGRLFVRHDALVVLAAIDHHVQEVLARRPALKLEARGHLLPVHRATQRGAAVALLARVAFLQVDDLSRLGCHCFCHTFHYLSVTPPW